ncbi:MAG: hypothetical protein AB1611_18975 [bacterium]
MSLTIGWFTTAEDSKAHDLFTGTYKAIHELGLNVDIAYLFCNRRKGEDSKSDQFLTSVQELGINLITHSSLEFQKDLKSHPAEQETGFPPDWYEEYHRQVMEKISNYPIDIALLVGYTPRISIEFVRKYTAIQFRSALPDGPSGTWPTVIWQLIGTRSAEAGATLHLLTEDDTERGIPITYCNYFIKRKEFSSFWQDLDRRMRTQPLSQLMATEGESIPLFSAIKEAGEELESPLINLTLQDIITGVIRIEDRMVYRNGELLVNGYCLTQEIETFLIEQEEGEEEEEEEEYFEEEDEEAGLA